MSKIKCKYCGWPVEKNEEKYCGQNPNAPKRRGRPKMVRIGCMVVNNFPTPKKD